MKYRKTLDQNSSVKLLYVHRYHHSKGKIKFSCVTQMTRCFLIGFLVNETDGWGYFRWMDGHETDECQVTSNRATKQLSQQQNA